MHHDISSVAVLACSVCGLAAKEDTGVRVHGGLVGGNRSGELPHDDGLWMVNQVLADARNVLDKVEAQAFKLATGSQARVQHEAWGVNGTGSKNDLLARLEKDLLASSSKDGKAGGNVVLDNNLVDPSLGENGQIGSSLLAAEDGVNVGDRRTAAVTIVWVIRDGEETGAPS